MAIVITTISEERIRVRNKIVYKDMNGNWVSVSELTASETVALQEHLAKEENEVKEQPNGL